MFTSFVSTANTLMANSHQPREIWEETIQHTFSGDFIGYAAKKTGLSHDCVFSIRHKILLAICDIQAEEKVCLSGISGLDETFVLDSYKGGQLPRKHL